MKYHVNSKTGRAGQCKATKVGCPLGADTPHFDTKKEAQNFIEKSEAAKNKTTSSFSKSIESKTIDKEMSFGFPNFNDDDKVLGEYLKGKSLKSLDNHTLRRELDLYLADEIFELSDGSVFAVAGNEGCGGCEAGNYFVDGIKEYPHQITKIEISCETTDDGYYDRDIYTIKAYSKKDKKGTTIVQVEGTIGNGYYGEGYDVTLIPSKDVNEAKEKLGIK